MSPWTESYSKFFALYIATEGKHLTADEVDEIVIDLMALIDRINRYEHRELSKIYSTILPVMPTLRAKAAAETASRMERLEGIMLDIVNLSNSVKK